MEGLGYRSRTSLSCSTDLSEIARQRIPLQHRIRSMGIPPASGAFGNVILNPMTTESRKEQPITYVRHAPKRLIEYYEALAEDMPEPTSYEKDGIDLKLLRRLVTYPGMNEAWKELAKEAHAPKMLLAELYRWDHATVDEAALKMAATDPAGYVADMIFSCAERCLAWAQPLRSRAQVRDDLRGLATAARSFAEEIKASRFDVDTHRYFPLPTLWALFVSFSAPVRQRALTRQQRSSDGTNPLRGRFSAKTQRLISVMGSLDTFEWLMAAALQGMSGLSYRVSVRRQSATCSPRPFRTVCQGCPC